MKRLQGKLVLAFLLTVLLQQQIVAADTTHSVHAFIWLPLQLDSLFSGNNYRYGNSIPKNVLPALEFYNGVQMAADSLNQEGIPARIEILDSRKANSFEASVAQTSHRPALLIGVIQSGQELKAVSAAASAIGLPFISATYPNDGGVTGSPHLMIANATLKTHCFGLYNYLQKNARSNNIVVFCRKKNADDRILNYFKEADKAAIGQKLKWKLVNVSDTVNGFEASVYLDSTKINTVVGASLDVDFASRLVSSLSAIRNSYPANIFGMPTWDDIPLERVEYKNVDVFYSTSFLSYSGNPEVFSSINSRFKKATNSRPSDMVFKGFEMTYRYIKTMYQHPDDFMQQVNNKQYKLFTEFDFEPVTSVATPADSPVNYLENKRVYFIKKTDGQVKGVY